MSSQADGRKFERRVVDAYRALGYKVTHNVQLPGKQTDLLAQREVEGAPALTLAVECKDWAEPVGNETVLSFISRIIAQKASNEITGGVLVSSAGFTADAQAAGAANPSVTLLSWDDLSAQILDVRNQMRARISAYESSSIYHEYLPLNVEVLGWESLTPALEQQTFEEVLEDWMGGHRPAMNSLFVLADFGAGKTTLLRRLEHERAKAYMAGEETRVPLSVPLREYRNTQDLDALLRWSFRDSYFRDIPSDLLWSRVESGRFHIFFDGFDEMVERSDARRRLDLFAALLPVLRSKSPTVLTSRPSYFVELGELEMMLTMLRRQEAEIAVLPKRGELEQVSKTDRLSRELVDIHREARPKPDAYFPLNPRNVRVLGLRALDSEQIEEFLERRAGQLREAGTSPQAVMSFIARTYDLSDLASRPLLLTFIITLVVIRELDVEDSETQFGASGLYEIYTSAKLRHDIAKGMTRQGGLSLELRRALAEYLALRMYEVRTLELEFAGMVEELMAEGGEIAAQLADTGFAREEIATDFATCSFATLDQDGKCRFIHKSFRGFFVARVLKDGLEEPGELLRAQNLESEVLYFLGGFAPTEPNLGERLWAGFERTDKRETILRRNLLLAFLFTEPEHKDRQIEDVEISASEFGRLEFDNTELKNVSWLDCVVRRLRVKQSSWRATRMFDTRVVEMSVAGGELELSLDGGAIERLKGEDSTLRLELTEASIETLSAEGGTLSLATAASRIESLQAKGAQVHCRGVGRGRVLGSATVSDSTLRLEGGGADFLRAQRSIIACEQGSYETLPGWELTACLVRLAPNSEDPGGRAADVRIEGVSGSDRDSVVLAGANLPPRLLALMRAGIFGSLPDASKVSELLRVPRAWGLVDAQVLFERELTLPPHHEGYRHGGLLLVTREWYLRETGSGGAMSSLVDLKALSENPPAEGGERLGKRVIETLARIRTQFDALGINAWPELERSGGEGSELQREH